MHDQRRLGLQAKRPGATVFGDHVLGTGRSTEGAKRYLEEPPVPNARAILAAQPTIIDPILNLAPEVTL